MNYPTNRLIVLISIIASLSVFIFLFLVSRELILSITSSLQVGLMIFFLWAITREFDPDNDLSAFLPVIFSLPLILVLGIAPFLPLLFLLLILRIVNRSTGRKAGLFDSILLLLLGSVLAYQISWIFAIIVALAFYLDGSSSLPHKPHFLFSALSLLCASILIIFKLTVPVFDVSTLKIIAFTILIFVSLVLLKDRFLITSVGDNDGKLLDIRRVNAARILLIFSIFAFMFFSDTLWELWIPLWLIPVGTGLYHILLKKKLVHA